MKASKPPLSRLLELQQLLLAFSQIDRGAHRRHQADFRAETDSEHSYNLAMTAWFLAPYFPRLDANLLIKLSLAHDLVEIHAGDTNAYTDEQGAKTKQAREQAAQLKLAKEWTDFPELHKLIEMYEARLAPEARFVYALDKLMPTMLIYQNEGYSWTITPNISVKRIHQVKAPKVALSPEIQPYYDELRKLLLSAPHLIQPE